MATYRIETDQGTFDIEADREPTHQEALQAISGSLTPSPSPAAVAAPAPPSEYDIARKQFIQKQQQPFLSKAIEQAVAPIGAVGGIISDIAGIPAGLGEVSGSENPAATYARSVLEGERRAGVDINNIIRNLPGLLVKASPLSIPSNLYNLRSRTPSESEIEKAVQEQLMQQNLMSPENQLIQGQIAPSLAQGVRQAVPLAVPLVGAEERVLAAGLPQATATALASPVQTAKAIGRGALQAVAPKVAARTAPATVEQSAMAALDFTPEQVAEHIPVVTQRVQELVGKVPKNTKQAISYINDAENQIYKDRLEFNNAAEKQGLVVKGDVALQNAADVLDAIPTITEEQKTGILNDLSDIYKGDHTPSKGQAIQQRLNKEFAAQYENGTFDRANPLNEAKLAIRNSFADQMDQISQAITGRAETPYADIGSLIEVRGGLTDKLNKLQAREAARKTGIEAAPSKLPTSKFEAAKQATKTALTPFQKTQIERLDESVNRIFSESPTQPPAIPLTPNEVQSLRQSFSPIPESQALETQIQDLIKTYPKDVRSNPFLARKVAETELGITSP